MKKLYGLLGLMVGIGWLVSMNQARANHIYGGNFSLQATATNEVYDLTLTLFYNKARIEADPTSFDSNLDVYVFRKRDNALIESFNLEAGALQTIYGNNTACAKLQDIPLVQVNYTSQIRLLSATYNDPLGYYVIWERCCRTDNITNLRSPSSTGMVFRMDFQANDSSPKLKTPPAEYICLNQPFEVDFSATDADGDQLTYELSTPLAGYTSLANVRGLGTSRTSYPPVQWGSGFGETNIIPGSPALSIDKNTGKLTIKASQTGLFVFSLVVREYRGGREIGQVRRDYQLPVVDCRLNTPSPAKITYNGRDSSEIVRCDNSPVTLAIVPDTTFGYQWQRNGKDITGATSYTLSVTDAGKYTVVKKFLRKCGTDTTSKAVNVLPPAPPVADILARRTVLISKTDTLQLLAQPQPATYRYRWSTDGPPLPGATQPGIVVNQPGVYTLRVSTANDRCPAYDSIRIDRVIRLFTADAFSPNGDGLNDTWEIRNITDEPDCEVIVFNRWGEPVFRSKGYATPWDGTYNAQKVPPGVYQYIIRVPSRTSTGSLHVLY